MEKEITIFISEDAETSKKIIHDHFAKNKVTYAEVMPAQNKEKIVEFLESIEEDFLTLP